MFFYLNNMTSMFAINGVLYGGYFVISIVYFAFIMASKKSVIKVMGIVAVCWAVLVHMGTGAIFGFVAAREAWVSPIKPFEFLAAALTSGIALLIVVSMLTLKLTGRDIKKEIVRSLGRMLVVFIVILFVLILMDKLTHLYVPHREATLFMLAGRFSWIFWVLQIGLVVVAPLAILVHPRLGKSMGAMFVASLLVVVGIFFERYYLVIPGAAYPQHYYPGNIEGVYGPVRLLPLWAYLKIGLSIGNFCPYLGLVFMVGLEISGCLYRRSRRSRLRSRKRPKNQ